MSGPILDALEREFVRGAPKPTPEKIHFALLTPNRAQQRQTARARGRKRAKG